MAINQYKFLTDRAIITSREIAMMSLIRANREFVKTGLIVNLLGLEEWNIGRAMQGEKATIQYSINSIKE
jgi:hypothetical protein